MYFSRMELLIRHRLRLEGCPEQQEKQWAGQGEEETQDF